MIKFEKYHGLGNDFIIFNYDELIEQNITEEEFQNLAIKVCNRNTGIGADGIMIVVLKENRESAQMIFINADGSVGAMCGNGIRCFSNYIYNNKLLSGRSYKVETLAGLMILDIFPKEEEILVKVNMGKPIFETKLIPMSIDKNKYLDEIIEIEEKNYHISAILMGVPHVVIFVEDVEKIDIEKLGKILEKHPLFTKGTNVNFVEIIKKDKIRVETWERGAGHTLACGTGSCASVVVGELLGKLNAKTTVMLTLGELEIEINKDVYMTGPAQLIARGEYKYN